MTGRSHYAGRLHLEDHAKRAFIDHDYIDTAFGIIVSIGRWGGLCALHTPVRGSNVPRSAKTSSGDLGPRHQLSVDGIVEQRR